MNNNIWLGAAIVAVALTPLPGAAQEAALSGRVTDQQGRAVPGVTVRIAAVNAGGLSGQDGTYRFVVPAGRVTPGQALTITATRQGFNTASQPITLSPGQQLTHNIQLSTAPIMLADLVVTGTAGSVEQRKVPFEVAQVSGSDIVVQPSSAAGALQGRVAGVTVVQGSGRPGSAPSVLLRGPKSIDAAGRNQEPLYIVDGVILNSSIADIDAADIEEMEVLKGAAAASLYGSRAANGVVQIRTRRGNTVPGNGVRYTARTEFGRSSLPTTPGGLLTESHHYLLTVVDGDTMFVDGSGVPCHFYECTNRGLQNNGTDAYHTYQNGRYPGTTYDQIDRFFKDGDFMTTYVSAEGRAGLANFHVSYSNLRDQGIIPGLDGLTRHNFRLNMDQAIRSNLSMQASAFYSRSETDQFPENNTNPIFGLTRMPAGVNLFACEGDPTKECLDDPQNLVLQPHPTNTESANPLYDLLNRDYRTQRGRFLGSANIRFAPLSWFELEANASYDRLDRADEDYFHKGYRTIDEDPQLNEGYLDRFQVLTEAFNSSLTGTFRFDLSNSISNRTQLRYLYEQADDDQVFSYGYGFAANVRSFTVANPENFGVTGALEPVRADGYFATTNFDISDRYIIDALVRNDGSSLFGKDQRRQWYYRLAGAWLVSEEPWFNLPVVDDLKLRLSRGTAGGRPAFASQYETFDLQGGAVIPRTLGNVDLRPEFTTETEGGLELGLWGQRLKLDVNYAHSTTQDQILSLPLPALSGFESQTINAGTLASNTWEVSLDARLVNHGDLTWDMRVNYDRTRTSVTQLNVPAFRYGVTGQGLTNVFWAREGEQLGTFYGLQFAQNCGQLPTGVDCSQFTTNDDGYLVWVGEGGSLNNPQWGTLAPADIRFSNPLLAAMRWGQPFGGLCVDRASGEQTDFCPLGKTLPDYTLGLSSNVSFSGLSLYALVSAVQGYSVYNQPLQWAVFQNISGLSDQTGIAPENQKPISYYGDLYGASGLRPSSAFVEDASFLKLREVAVRYRVGDGLRGRIPGISGTSGMTLSLTGRNLATWTNYRGFDPEVGKADGNTGSAALGRIEGYQYPSFRTWTLGVELNF